MRALALMGLFPLIICDYVLLTYYGIALYRGDNAPFWYAIAKLGKGMAISVQVGGVYMLACWLLQPRMAVKQLRLRPLKPADNEAVGADVKALLAEMCRPAGIAAPEIRILRSPNVNSLSLGTGSRTYKIILTEAMIQQCGQDEIRAALAHELTHILNRDTRLLTVMVQLCSLVPMWCERVLGKVVGKRKTRNNILWVLFWPILLLNRLCLRAERDYLADAGAVEITGDTNGMVKLLNRMRAQEVRLNISPFFKALCLHDADGGSLMGYHPDAGDRADYLQKSFHETLARRALSPSLGRATDFAEEWKEERKRDIISAIDTADIGLGQEISQRVQPMAGAVKRYRVALRMGLGGLLIAAALLYGVYHNVGRDLAGAGTVVLEKWSKVVRSADGMQVTEYYVRILVTDKDGTTHEEVVKANVDRWGALAKGSKADLDYVQAQLEKRYQDMPVNQKVMLGGGALVGIISLCVTLASFIGGFVGKAGRARRLHKSGKRATGHVTGTRSHMKRNRRMARVAYEYEDDAGTVHPGLSDPLPLATAQLYELGSNVLVYYHPKKPSVHYADIM